MITIKKMFDYFWFRNVFAAVSYFCLAKMGAVTGNISDIASLFWPPTGLTFFLLMIWGNEVLIGLFLGAFVAGPLFNNFIPVQGLTLFNLYAAVAMAAASVGQCWLIYCVSTNIRTSGFRVDLRQTIFFCLATLLFCSIGSLINNYFLWKTGIAQAPAALLSVFVWWLGDAIGVLLIAPILFWLFKKDIFRYNTLGNAFLAFNIGAGVVLLIVVTIGHRERETQQSNLAAETTILQTLMQNSLDLSVRELETLNHYYIHNTPSANDFINITEPMLDRTPWLTHFTLMPVKINSQSMNDPQTLGYSITNRDRHLQETNDVYSLNPAKIDAINAERIRIQWSKPPLSTPSIEIFNLVENCQPIEQKPICKIKYAITSHIDLNEWMKNILDKFPTKNLRIRLSENRAEQTALIEWNGKEWISIANASDFNPFAATSYVIEATKVRGNIPSINIYGQIWQIQINPTTIYPWFFPSYLQIFILFIGSIIILLLTYYLHALHKNDLLTQEHHKQLKQEIAQQTQALRDSNQQLLQEINERYKAQAQLTQSENHLRTLLDNIPDPIWFKSNEGEYLNFNKAVKDIFLKPLEDIIHHKSSDFATEELDNQVKALDQKALNAHAAVKGELWMYIPKFDELRLMDTIKVAVRNLQGEPQGILSIARDITEKYKLIDELKVFKGFAEYSNQGFIIANLKGEVIYQNPCIKRMIDGKALLENFSVNHLDYYPASIHTKLQQDIFPQVHQKGYWSGELIHKRADNTEFPTYETMFMIRNEEGEPSFIGDLMLDISDQKKFEQELREAKEIAEQATHAKSRFLANMSHEIRTPLNAILGYSQLLLATSSGSQHEKIQAILSAGHRLLSLINDILDLSKIESGALQIRTEYFDLYRDLSDIVQMMQTKALAKNLIFDVSIDLPSPCFIESDKHKLGQIIINLLGNAIKFTHHGSLSLSSHIEGGDVIFCVTDTGVGIDSNELKELFSAFKQGKAGENTGGTGLGLVISKNIAEHMGGSLTLESELGKGTRAYLRLPLKRVESFDAVITNGQEHLRILEGERLRVLVAEDDDASREILVTLLENLNCEVFSAINGAEGFDIVANEKIDIVFTDIRMPVMDGVDMFNAIRTRLNLTNLPIVAVTASSLTHERDYYLRTGFQEFIGKPYNFNQVHRILLNLLPHKFYVETIPQTNAPQKPVTVDWNQLTNAEELEKQLRRLQESCSAGDIRSAKKYFGLLDEQTIGHQYHQRLKLSMGQHDLAQSDKILAELLDEIKSRLN